MNIEEIMKYPKCSVCGKPLKKVYGGTAVEFTCGHNNANIIWFPKKDDLK